MEEDDKECPMIRLGVSGWVFLLVPAYPGCPGQKPLNGCVCVCARVCVCVRVCVLQSIEKRVSRKNLTLPIASSTLRNTSDHRLAVCHLINQFIRQ